MPRRTSLRAASTKDIPAIQALANRIWWAHYPGIISEAQIAYMLELMYSAEALERQMTEEGVHFWLIRQRVTNADIGFIAVSQQTPDQYFIHKFYLEAALQGKGLGSEAFEQLLEQYPDAREMRLTVNRQNVKSINFYFKIGFRIERCADFDIGGGFWMNDFVMHWRRPPADDCAQASDSSA